MNAVVKLTQMKDPSQKIHPRFITRALGQWPRFWPRMAISWIKIPKIVKVMSFYS